MSNIEMNQMEWDTLLIPETLSDENLKSHAAIVADYINGTYSDESLDLSSIKRVTEVSISEDLLDSKELVVDKISNDILFEYLREENVTVDLNLRFPRIKHINHLFWFLHNLAEFEVTDSKIIITNTDELSIGFYRIIESAMFFGYLKRVRINNETYYVPTEYYESFLSESTKEQYSLFLASLGRNETVSEVLKIQLNDPIYDNISRQMVYNILVKDPNIAKEQLSKDEINHILNNFRYWYLNIKKAVLED